MKELKPCPFCGGEAKISHESEGVLVRCQKCGATSGWIDEYLETEDSGVKKAIGLWNRRAAPENKALTLEQLRQMDGEPVWIVTKRDAGWDIVNVSKEDGSPYLVYFQEYGHYLKENGYGKTWLAYARRPEDAT